MDDETGNTANTCVRDSLIALARSRLGEWMGRVARVAPFRNVGILALAIWAANPGLAPAQESVPVAKIYWGDRVTPRIQRADPDGSNVEDLIGGAFGFANGIAFDPGNGKMYWTAEGIFRSNLDGALIEQVYTSQFTAHGIALDLTDRKMYWIDSAVRRANLDGSNVEDLVTSGLTFPRSIALDLTNGKMYWSELGSAGGGARRIRRANLDGSQVEVVLDGLAQPHGISLDVAAGKIYWVEDQFGSLLQRANLDGSQVELLHFIRTRSQSTALDLDQGKIYWARITTGEIQRANLDLSGIETVVSGLIQPGPIALLPELPLAITTSLSAVTLGKPFALQFETRAGVSPFSWSVIDGQLPVAMELSEDGIFSGTPTELGDSTFTVEVIDSNGDSAEKEFSVQVALVAVSNIRLQKTGTLAVPGRLMDYFILVDNTGNSDADSVQVLEISQPDSAFSIEASSPQPTSIFKELIIWDLPRLSAGQSTLLSYRGTLSQSFPLGETVVGSVQHICSTCKQTDECRFLPTICSIGGIICDPLTGCTSASPACLSAAKACQQRCRSLCPDDGRDDDTQDATGPLDPNEKLVTAGEFIQTSQTLVYPIHFENIGQVEAIDVFITDILDPNLDDTTLEILSPGATYEPSTRVLQWQLLGRNLLPGESDNVLFSIKPVPGLPTGTEIRNDAEIQFEVFNPLITPEVVNIIDTTPPECVMDSLPAQTTSEDFTVSWSSSDAVGEIAAQSVFVSVDGSTFEPIIENTLDTQATFNGMSGRTHGFLCAAKDTAGNVEDQDAVAEAVTLVVTNLPPVANAGPNQTAECSSPNGSTVTLNGGGSSDPDGDPLSFLWDGPFGTLAGQVVNPTLPLGTHNISLTVEDGKGGSDSDSVLVIVEDTTPPVLLAALVPVGEGDEAGDSDEGRFEAQFSAADVCSPGPTMTAVLSAPGCSDIAVGDGQVFEFEFEDDECEAELENGIYEIEAPGLELIVDAVDANANEANASAEPQGLSGDNDDDDDVVVDD